MRSRRARRDERGAASVELALITPALLAILMLVFGLTRMAPASPQVEAVAADSARAASLVREPGGASAAAQQAARRSLGDAGLACTAMNVAVDVGSYRPGGAIRVTVDCTARLGDVAMAGFPGSRRFSATSTVPIESYRARR